MLRQGELGIQQGRPRCDRRTLQSREEKNSEISRRFYDTVEHSPPATIPPAAFTVPVTFALPTPLPVLPVPPHLLHLPAIKHVPISAAPAPVHRARRLAPHLPLLPRDERPRAFPLRALAHQAGGHLGGRLRAGPRGRQGALAALCGGRGGGGRPSAGARGELGVDGCERVVCGLALQVAPSAMRCI